MSFDFADVIVHNRSEVHNEGAGLIITTPETQWAYAAEIPLIDGPTVVGRVRISVSLDCSFGTVGVALLHRGGSQFVSEAQVAGNGQIAMLSASSLEDVKSIIFRNDSALGPSGVVVKNIDVGAAADELQTPVAIDQSKFLRSGSIVRLPRRHERQLNAATASLLPPYGALVGSVLVNAYVKEVLGKKTYGRVLNIGTVEQSARYRYDLRIRNSAYHTVGPSGEFKPTYVADARCMPEVPTAYYDWVIAMLQDISDIHAVVAEIQRVLKSGGCTYLMVTNSYGNSWRASPSGFHQLLDSAFSFEEVEYWGDCVIDPVGVGVIVRKGGAQQKGTSRLYYVDGGLESMHRYIRSDVPFRWTMPVSRLSEDGIEYCLRVKDFRAKHFSDTGYSMTHRQADQYMFHEVAIPEGVITVCNEESSFIPTSDRSRR